ncbi:MAG: FtsW/RodA/SpoVE family cell cycle protein [Christensenellaceae bacterium]|jgi:cell division protein FtsW|nr:FtsW/RodA/SpoVE family cell cycle protein [Christensenellaceae bacterium]
MPSGGMRSGNRNERRAGRPGPFGIVDSSRERSRSERIEDSIHARKGFASETFTPLSGVRRPAARSGREGKEPGPEERIRLFVFGQGLSFDYGVLILTFVLMVVGLLMVLSASSYEGIVRSSDSLAEFRNQALWAAIGFSLMLLIMNIDYRVLKRPWVVGAGVGLTLLMLLAVIALPKLVSGPPIWSPYVNYSHRWLRVGTSSAFLSVQPSEIAKITLILFLAWFFDRQAEQMKSLKKTIIPALAIAGSYAGLILLQPNLSTLGAILIVTLLMMYVAGSRWWVNTGLIAAGVAFIVTVLQFMPDRLKRYTSFRDPWAVAQGDGWQLVQSYFALANGRWAGTGIGMSRQKLLFLPYSSSDFIFAIVGEELGFIGASVILIGFMLLIFFGIRVALNAQDRFGCYLASGTTMMLAVQVVINILVVTGWMPTTGLPLPFFTAGGTTLMIFLCSMGLLLSVSRRKNAFVRKISPSPAGRGLKSAL